MKRGLVLGAVLGISPAFSFYGTALALGQRNWRALDHAVTTIELHDTQIYVGADAARERAVHILEMYDGTTDRLLRRRGAINAATEYLQGERK